MKILFIHIYFTNRCSGASTIVNSLYSSLGQNGHEVYIFSTDEQPYYNKNYPYIKYFVKSSENLTHDGLFNYLKYLLNKIYNTEAQDKLAKMLDEIKPDIVHIHTIGIFSYSIIRPIKKRKIPIVYTAHDPRYCCPAIFLVGKNFCNMCKKLNTFPCLFKRCANNDFVKSLQYSIKAMFDRINCPIYAFDKIITPSQATADYMSQFDIPQNKFAVLENFLQKEDLKKEPNYTNNGYFVYAGGIHYQKGIFTLIEAFKQLPKDIELHVAGEAPLQNDNDKFQAILKENNLSNVKFLGRLTKEQMQDEYKNCISVIMPSECFETFGMINIEAAIWGKPSISSNIGGLPDVVEHNKTGLIFEPTNIEQLQESILKYWKERDLAIEHGKNAREKALREYHEDKYFKKLIKIYEDVIKNVK